MVARLYEGMGAFDPPPLTNAAKYPHHPSGTSMISKSKLLREVVIKIYKKGRRN
jgi:hypothetical protein